MRRHLLLFAVTLIAASAAAPSAARADHGCGRFGRLSLSGSDHTSCAFARSTLFAVGRWVDHHRLSQGRRFNVRAYSSVTRRTYRMYCQFFVTGSRTGAVYCHGGKGARVYIDVH